jgi:hypothetical protein
MTKPADLPEKILAMHTCITASVFVAILLMAGDAHSSREYDTIGYAWRIYGASEDVENRSWDPIDAMQVVSGGDIIKE